VDKIEGEVERYFGGLYTRTFDHTSPFPSFATDDWSDDLEGPISSS
jgi:hypothetical protein